MVPGPDLEGVVEDYLAGGEEDNRPDAGNDADSERQAQESCLRFEAPPAEF
jgi:hypothetical protein